MAALDLHFGNARLIAAVLNVSPGLCPSGPAVEHAVVAGPAAIAIGPLDGNAHLQQFVDRLVGMVLESEIVNQRQFFRGQLD